ncbi:MAG: serine protease [Planctomycetes bacterium]|nr:serine protease [Planctomycetota bacterium]
MRRTGAVALVLAGSWMAWTAPTARAGVEEIIDQTLQRVVKLYGTGAGREQGYASGIVVSDDGLVLTVAALLLESRDLLAVTHDGTRYRASVVARDDTLQVALLQLHSTAPDAETPVSGMTHFSLDDPPAVTSGDWVFAAGNPFRVAVGDEPVSISMGVISTRTRLRATRRKREFPYYGDVLVIDASTSNPGSPGGALVNLDGRLVGMIGRVVKSKTTNTLVNYAMPVDVLHDFYERSLANVVPARRERLAGRSGDEERRTGTDAPLGPTSTTVFHGIKLFSLGYKTDLPFVERVLRGSPAEVAGIRKDDLIRAISGQTVRSSADFDRLFAQHAPGDMVEILVIRGRNPVTMTLTLEPGRALPEPTR